MIKAILVTVVIIALVWESSEILLFGYSKLKGGVIETEEVNGMTLICIVYPDDSHMLIRIENGILLRVCAVDGGLADKIYGLTQKHPLNRLANWLKSRKE